MGTGVAVWQRIVDDHIKPLGAGDEIRINMYGISYNSTTAFVFDAIDDAAKDGADVFIVTEKYPSWANSGAGQTVTNLPHVPSANIRYCRRGCEYTGTASSAKNHSKFILINKNGSLRGPIIQGSMNILSSTFDDYEVATFVDGTHYTTTWDKFAYQFESDWCLAASPTGSGCTKQPNSRVYNGWVQTVIPGPVGSYNALDKDFFERMTYYPGCALRLTVGTLGQSSSVTLPVIQELRRIANDGCKVDLIYGGSAQSWISSYCGSSGSFECENQSNVHAKMFLWQGMWDHDFNPATPQVLEGIVFAGSTNITYNSIRRNDEHHIGLRSDAEFEAAWNYFQHIEYDNP